MLVFPCSVILYFTRRNAFSLHIEEEEEATTNKRKGRLFFLSFGLVLTNKGQQTYLDGCLPLSVPVILPSLLYSLCLLSSDLSLEALYIDYLLESLHDLLLAPST